MDRLLVVQQAGAESEVRPRFLTKGTLMTARRTLSRLAVPTLVGVVVALTPWAPASAAVQCGAVLTSNTKLTSDLSATPPATP